MVFFIYQLGSLASVWAISNLIKKDVPQRIKNKIIVLLLVTSWIGVLGYFFILKNRIEKWWPCKKYLVAHRSILYIIAIKVVLCVPKSFSPFIL